jgi:hypothetical protein
MRLSPRPTNRGSLWVGVVTGTFDQEGADQCLRVSRDRKPLPRSVDRAVIGGDVDGVKGRECWRWQAGDQRDGQRSGQPGCAQPTKSGDRGAIEPCAQVSQVNRGAWLPPKAN